MACRFGYIVVGDHHLCNLTSIGVVVFDKDGNYFGHRLDSIDRAVRRGDYPANADADRLEGWVRSFTSIAELEKRAESIGYAMSSTQIHLLGGSIEEPEKVLNDEFARMTKR